MKQYRQLYTVLMLLGYLGSYNGYLALWRSENAVPDQIFPRPINIYPDIDQSELKKGIPFSSAESLANLLEDFLS